MNTKKPKDKGDTQGGSGKRKSSGKQKTLLETSRAKKEQHKVPGVKRYRKSKDKNSVFDHFIGSNRSQAANIARMIMSITKSHTTGSKFRVGKEALSIMDSVVNDLLRYIVQNAALLSRDRTRISVRDLQGAVQNILVSPNVIKDANAAGTFFASQIDTKPSRTKSSKTK
jgi:histone H3/H4